MTKRSKSKILQESLNDHRKRRGKTSNALTHLAAHRFPRRLRLCLDQQNTPLHYPIQQIAD